MDVSEKRGVYLIMFIFNGCLCFVLRFFLYYIY